MKKRVFDYVQKHPGTDVHQIAEALKETEINVLEAINSLSEKEYICLCSPIPLSADNLRSCRYRALKQEYTEK